MDNENQHIETYIVNEISKALKRPFSTLHNFINLLFSIIVLFGLSFGLYLFYQNIQISKSNNKQIELLNKYYLIQNKQSILLKIVDEKLRYTKNEKLGSASMDDKVKLVQTWIDLSNLKNIPLSLLCAIAEVESSWCLKAVSNMGCVGILQVNPVYAKAYLREKSVNYRPDVLFDPVLNSYVGISMLMDFQDYAIESGLGSKDNWSYPLRSYFFGPSLKNNILDMNYSLKVINKMKEYDKDNL